MTRNVAQRTTRLYYKGLFWLSLFLLSFHLLFYWIICAALPRAGPTISGLAAVYTPGQRVTAVCSTNSSLPAPRLAWYSDQQDLTSTAQLTTAAGPAGLLDTLSRLELTVNNNHCQVMQVTPLSSYNIITIGPRYSGQFKSQFSSNLASIPQPWTMDIGTGVCKWINLSQIILFVHTTEATAVVNRFALFTTDWEAAALYIVLLCRPAGWSWNAWQYWEISSYEALSAVLRSVTVPHQPTSVQHR